MDITPHIQPKSDQLNADSLISGPITVKVEGVSQGNSEQPVTIKISGGHMPWKPCKTALRVLAAAWGTDANKWIGRWVTLYCDPSVTWAGAQVGGVRVQAVSHIDKPMTLNLSSTRGKKKPHEIGVLDAGKMQDAGAPTADLDALLRDNELTRVDVDRWRASIDKPALDTLTDDQRAQLAAFLASNPNRVEEIRALAPEPPHNPDTGEVTEPAPDTKEAPGL